MATGTTDVRTGAQKRTMTETFDEYEVEYREDNEHTTVVYEDTDCVIVADHTGHALREWAEAFDTPREDLRASMRALAEQKMGEQDAHEAFSHADPVVFDKFEDA